MTLSSSAATSPALASLSPASVETEDAIELVEEQDCQRVIHKSRSWCASSPFLLYVGQLIIKPLRQCTASWEKCSSSSPLPPPSGLFGLPCPTPKLTRLPFGSSTTAAHRRSGRLPHHVSLAKPGGADDLRHPIPLPPPRPRTASPPPPAVLCSPPRRRTTAYRPRQATPSTAAPLRDSKPASVRSRVVRF